jgi:hypothetical protein
MISTLPNSESNSRENIYVTRLESQFEFGRRRKPKTVSFSWLFKNSAWWLWPSHPGRIRTEPSWSENTNYFHSVLVASAFACFLIVIWQYYFRATWTVVRNTVRVSRLCHESRLFTRRAEPFSGSSSACEKKNLQKSTIHRFAIRICEQLAESCC